VVVAVFGGALLGAAAVSVVVEFPTSSESLMSGAIVLNGSSTPSPENKT